MQRERSKTTLEVAWKLTEHGRVEMIWKATRPADLSGTSFAALRVTLRDSREAA